jgi:hypothetical protein
MGLGSMANGKSNPVKTSAKQGAPRLKPQRQEKPKLPEFEMDDDGSVKVILRDEDQVSTLFGGSSSEFAEALLMHCVNVSGKSVHNVKDKSFAVAIVGEIAPEDGIEAMLATQMAAVHIATMRHSRLMAGVDTLQQLEVHERIVNKLARTFATQMEALRKHRNGGKQTVTVQHVNVEGGGKAIVGNVTHGGGGKDGK